MYHRMLRFSLIRFLCSPMGLVGLIFVLDFSVASGGAFAVPEARLASAGAFSSGVPNDFGSFFWLCVNSVRALFLHATRLHLVFDLILFVWAAVGLLREMAPGVALGVFLLSGWVGNVLFFFTRMDTPGIWLLGSSGGTCGLLGALSVLLVAKRMTGVPGAPWGRLAMTIGLSAFLLIEALLSDGRVPLPVHGGGFLVGVLIGVGVWRRRTRAGVQEKAV